MRSLRYSEATLEGEKAPLASLGSADEAPEAAGIEVARFRVGKGSFVNHCYVLIDNPTRSCFLVDPAWDAAGIAAFISQRGLSAAGVLVTHHHFDHVQLAEHFSVLYGCPIYVSEAEHNYYGLKLGRVVLVGDDCELRLGTTAVRPILTPGHTAGSTCFLAGDALFTGDTLFNEGCGACVGDGANPLQLYSSLQMLKTTIPRQARVYPGHRYHSDLGLSFDEVNRMNLYLQLDSAKQFVSFRMRKRQPRFFSFR
jgi:hydroxyacylglutathione hydrolase